MLKRTSLVFRLFVMLAMALGLATLMASPVAAQPQTVQCQTIIDGVIDQADCTVEVNDDGQCQVVVNGEIQQNIVCSPEGCPQQFINADGDIFQFQCSGVTQPTNVPATATNVPPTDVPATATNVPATATNVPATATNVPATATNVPATATDVPATATDVPATATTGPGTATHVPATATATDDGGQANPPDKDKDDKPMEVSVLPSTGQGPDNGQSNTANMLLLGAMGMVLTLGAVALRLRKNG